MSKGKFVVPRVYLIGTTVLDSYGVNGLWQYLEDTGNSDFIRSIEQARRAGISGGEVLCSFFAKLCYKSLTLGHNKNVSKVRDIEDNIKGCFYQGHSSVFEHCTLNFVITNCSRVFTHELVRHRVGTAFSQTSGRYVRGDKLDIVFDPILNDIELECLWIQDVLEVWYNQVVEKLGIDKMTDFNTKKKLTSALRRFLPNGQSNEIGFSVNLRALRHTIQIRTSRHAEWEIRFVFDQIYRIVKHRWPLIFYGAKVEDVDGLVEVSGMKLQPYERSE